MKASCIYKVCSLNTKDNMNDFYQSMINCYRERIKWDNDVHDVQELRQKRGKMLSVFGGDGSSGSVLEPLLRELHISLGLCDHISPPDTSPHPDSGAITHRTPQCRRRRSPRMLQRVLLAWLRP